MGSKAYRIIAIQEYSVRDNRTTTTTTAATATAT